MPSKTQYSSTSEDLDISEPPTTINPYKVLSVSKSATADEIKSAYRRLALKHHPDKATAENKDTAHRAFQELAFAYAVLSDERRRKRYDVTGRTEESLGLGDADTDDDFDWISYYKEQYEDVISGEAIERFAEEYKGSDEERDALLQAYEEHEGDMTQVYETVMTSDPALDDTRFREIINEAIERNEVQAHNKFTTESKKSINARIKRAQTAGKEAEEYAKEIGVHDKLFGSKKAGNKKGGGGSDESGLAALIQQRQKGRAGNFLADLEAKYAPKSKGKKGKRAAEEMVNEPAEEAFARNRKASNKGQVLGGKMTKNKNEATVVDDEDEDEEDDEKISKSKSKKLKRTKT